MSFSLPKSPSVNPRDRQRVDCHAGANGLWIWPLRDGAVVPARNTALVECKPASKNHTLLLPTAEAVFEHGELPAVMCRAFRTAFLLVRVDITPSIIVPIVIEM
jgi:hypothetical protein